MGHAHFCASLDDVTHLLGARGVPQCSGHEALFGPAAIAIHDDGNVLWQGVRALEMGQGGDGMKWMSILDAFDKAPLSSSRR
jgi:hypothetical protein